MAGFCKQIIRMLAALALALGFGPSAWASVPLQTCIAPLAASPLKAGSPHESPPPFDCGTDQSNFGSGDFAVQLRFASVRSDPANPLVLRFASAWQDSARVTFHFADGTSRTLALTANEPAQHLKFGAIIELPVPDHPAPLSTILIETSNSANLRGVMLEAKLMTRSEAQRAENWIIALYAGFSGLLLAMIAYNLSLFTVLRYRFQLYYAGRAACLGAYVLTTSGAVLMLWPALGGDMRHRLNYLLLSLTGLLAVRFIQSFFGQDADDPGLRRYVNLAAIGVVATSLVFCIFAPWQIRLLDRIAYVALALLLLGVAPIVWKAWRRGNRYVPLFLLAWCGPLGAAYLRIAHGFNLIDYSFWLANGNLVAIAIESLLSSMMIVMRLRELNQERDKARANEQSALRLANSDSLTGLLNRRAFLELAIGSPGQYRLMVVDLDYFKAINDRSGHDFGDDVLRRVAQIIQALRPRGSLAVRMGGEEFALLVPLDQEAECRPAQVLAAVRELELPLGTRVTASMGVAEGTVATEQDWRRLYRLADAALYRAKADGRDRVCRATDFANIAAA